MCWKFVPEVTHVPTNLKGEGLKLSWSFADIGLDMEAPGDLRSKLMGQQVDSKIAPFSQANSPKSACLRPSLKPSRIHC